MQRLEVSGAVRLIYRSLGVKGLRVKATDSFSEDRRFESRPGDKTSESDPRASSLPPEKFRGYELNKGYDRFLPHPF